MKTKEQIIEWLKSQEWYKVFCEKAGFCCEEELSEYIQSMMNRPKYIISTAFVWPEMKSDFWCDCEHDYLKWFNSEDEKPTW